MIIQESGAHITAQSRRQWSGLLRIILNVRWETEPGWIALTFDSPALCVVLTETGGRCQIRIQPEQPAQGDFFGTGHLSFVAPLQPLAVYAREMRDARIALYNFDLNKTDCLSSDQAAALAEVESRYMFRDDRLYECARLLGVHEPTNDRDIYGVSLARALQLALLAKAPRSTTLRGSATSHPRNLADLSKTRPACLFSVGRWTLASEARSDSWWTIRPSLWQRSHLSSAFPTRAISPAHFRRLWVPLRAPGFANAPEVKRRWPPQLGEPAPSPCVW